MLPVRDGCAIPTKGTSEPRFWTFSASWREAAHEQRRTLPLYAASPPANERRHESVTMAYGPDAIER